MLNPDNANVTEYSPGTSAVMLYRPCPSVTTVRTFSINAGLSAVTVTPGSTAPVSSDASPAMPCACVSAGAITTNARANPRLNHAFMSFSFG